MTLLRDRRFLTGFYGMLAVLAICAVAASAI